MKPIAVAGIVGGILGAGTLAFFKVVKPWLQRIKEEKTAQQSGGGSSSGGVVYTGITGAQTTMLQTTLNTMRQMFLNTPSSCGAAENAFLKSFPADLDIDGKYGNNTLNAVKALQTFLNTATKSKLNVDGKYGANTEKAFSSWSKGGSLNTKIVGA